MSPRSERGAGAAGSVSEFVEAVLDVRGTWFPGSHYDDMWFRGVNDNTLRLLPGAYWRERCDEESLVWSFRSLVPPLLASQPASDWEWYFLMQHYGLPTRLLDWTENALYALYFALKNRRSDSIPRVWILDPVSLNEATYGGEFAMIIAPGGLGTDAWLPDRCGRGIAPESATDTVAPFPHNRHPLAIYPVRVNPRIVAQEGVFTLHGSDESPLDALPAADKAQLCLTWIDLRGDLDGLEEELWSVGVRESSLFPEPASVARDLMRAYEVS